MMMMMMMMMMLIKFGFNCSQNWNNHEPKQVKELEEINLLWDFPIQTDHPIKHNRLSSYL